MTREEKTRKVITIGSAVSSVGMVGGLIYAFKKQKGFWGYVGYGLLFSTIGYTVGALPASILIKEDSPKSSIKNDEEIVKEEIKIDPNKTNKIDSNKPASNIIKKEIIVVKAPISEEKANQILGFWLKKKDEVAKSKMTADSLAMANTVMLGLKKALLEGGWIISDNKVVPLS